MIVSGTDINRVITFPASNNAESITVNFTLNDDTVGLEQQEVFRNVLADLDTRVQPAGNGLFLTTVITIEDDDSEITIMM